MVLNFHGQMLLQLFFRKNDSFRFFSSHLMYRLIIIKDAILKLCYSRITSTNDLISSIDKGEAMVLFFGEVKTYFNNV